MGTNKDGLGEYLRLTQLHADICPVVTDKLGEGRNYEEPNGINKEIKHWKDGIGTGKAERKKSETCLHAAIEGSKGQDIPRATNKYFES